MTCTSSVSPNDTLVLPSLLSKAAAAADEANEEGSGTPRGATGGNETAGGMLAGAPPVCILATAGVVSDVGARDVVLMAPATAAADMGGAVDVPFMVTGVMRRTLPTCTTF